MSLSLRAAVAGTILAGAVAGTLGFATAASASGGGGGVSKTVACSTGTLKLKAKADDPSVLQVEAELDTNVVGQRWTWSLTDNGVKVASGAKITAAPSGSWTVARTIADKAGTDALRFRTVMGTTVCAVNLSI